MALFFVYIENNIDRSDDNVLKIKAKSKKEAEEIASKYNNDYKETISRVFTMKEFIDFDPEWHTLLWRSRAINE